jgi:ubiquinone/menaquinone biosynthesis C-methylase UbiE
VVRRFLAAETAGRRAATPLRILDIGSGSCDIPLAVSRWARAHAIPLHITCLEMAEPAVRLAREKLGRAANPGVELLQEDVFAHQPAEPYDCAVASMCFHHFRNEQILALLRRLQRPDQRPSALTVGFPGRHTSAGRRSGRGSP